MSIESVTPSNHLVLCHPLLSLIFPSIRVFSNESVLRSRWPKHWSFSFSISPSNEYSGLISFKIDWFDLLAVQGTLKNLLQQHSSKASTLWHSAFFMVQLSHPYPIIRIFLITESQSLIPIRNLVENAWTRGFAACSCEDLGILATRTFSSPLGLDLDPWLLFSCSGVSNSLQHHGLQHARLPCSSLSPWASSNSCPLSWRCNPIISFTVAPFSFHSQSYPESGFFPMSRLFPSGGWALEL